MFDLQALVRENIRSLKPYSSARDEFSGEASVYLDANENPFESLAGAGMNRYPDPLQRALKAKIAPLKNVRPAQLFLGNGSDEPIDLLFRAFCEPKTDNVVQMVPTYGMYKVSADINNVEIRNVLLRPDFSLDAQALLDACDSHTKIVFLCSPNNPTGHSLEAAEVLKVVQNFPGLVVVDEAYADFSEAPSLTQSLDAYPNLVVLQTFSKAWGMAALRLGMCMASPEILSYLNLIKPPYNINELTQQAVNKALDAASFVQTWIDQIKTQRLRLAESLAKLDMVEEVYPSDSNFILIRVNDPKEVYNYLMLKGIIVRDRSTQPLCAGCLRITVGTEAENDQLLQHIENYVLAR
jgi:histidinol-phosphate aminotransferase